MPVGPPRPAGTLVQYVQPRNESVWRSPRRLVLAGLGLICVALAVAGAVLPGLPTTIFLIGASYCFARSCPWLEERLLRTKLFRPYLPYLDGSAPMPRRARVAALIMMWTAVTISFLIVRARRDPGALEAGPDWFGWTLLGAALVGTVAILLFRRER